MKVQKTLAKLIAIKNLRENVQEKFVTLNALDPFVFFIGYFTFACFRQSRISIGISIRFCLSIMATSGSATGGVTPI